jgi:putative ABC transport system ATP-binding protein
MNLVEISDLRKTYRMGATDVHALAGVNLQIPDGAFMLVMGPSGSGKSTLLYLLGGLDRASSGLITVKDQRLDRMDENQLAHFRQRFVGFIFQSFNLVSNMTAAQNVAFPMRFARVPRKQRERRAAELLQRVGLGDRMHHKPGELSGGQQQRVAIARALVNDPQLILADEPTGNLDSSSGAGIMQVLKDLHADGRTVLVVSHDPRMRAFATHLLFILDGKIVSEDEYLASVSLAM